MIRVATIGTSVITESLAAAVAAVDGTEIATVYSRDAERAAETAARLGVARSADDLDAVLADPSIDAVYIASPNSAHEEQALRAIRAGKHVLVEKPATPTAEAWRALVEAADAAGVVLLEAMRTAYDPGLAEVRRLLPELGPVRRVSFRYEKRSGRYDAVLAGRRVNMFDPAMAGGVLYDLGVYCVHPLLALFGMPRTVAATAVTVVSGVDGAGTALLGYDGFSADLAYSKITTSVLPSEIQGEDATLEIDAIASPRRLVVRGRDGAESEHLVEAPANTLVGEVRRFAQLIESGGTAAADHAATEATLEVVGAIRAAWS